MMDINLCKSRKRGLSHSSNQKNKKKKGKSPKHWKESQRNENLQPVEMCPGRSFIDTSTELSVSTTISSTQAQPNKEINTYEACEKRIVDVKYFIHQLQILNEHSASGCTISHMNIISEKRLGLNSSIKLKCYMCNYEKEIWTNPVAENSSFSLARAGISNMDVLFNVLNIPGTCVNTSAEQELISNAQEQCSCHHVSGAVRKMNDHLINDLLPDEILVHIFSYLKPQDLCKIARVCKRWYTLTRCPVLWKYVDVTLSEHCGSKTKAAAKLIQTLPTCTIHIKIVFNVEGLPKVSFSFKQFLLMLRKRCPNLQSLNLHSVAFTDSLSKVLVLCSTYLQNIKNLILRFCEFRVPFLRSHDYFHEFYDKISLDALSGVSKITMLDLFGSDLGDDCPSPFHIVPYLKRLNLARSSVDETDLFSCKENPSFFNGLEVLNLAGTSGSKPGVELGTSLSVLFQTVRHIEYHLTTLIVCSTLISDNDLTLQLADSKRAFRSLKTICLQNCSSISSNGIIPFIKSCPTLEVVYVDVQVLFSIITLHGFPSKCKSKPHTIRGVCCL